MPSRWPGQNFEVIGIDFEENISFLKQMCYNSSLSGAALPTCDPFSDS
jgi:hypothetical protein